MKLGRKHKVGVYAGPDVSENGLVLSLDSGSLNSFRGVNATNLSPSIGYNQPNTNNTFFKLTNGEETVYIPSLGYVTSKYVDIYNDYNGGSGACCPSLYTYGAGIAVSPSTTYTYSIIYKTTTGYSHPNYMYRYEYSPSAYVTEAGIHSTNNRTSLGDGWWFAWGQFTTSSTTATINTYLFHYEYATQNRVYVYRAAIYQGTYVIPPEHMLTSGQVRGTTVATGGGLIDLTARGNNGTLVSGVSYSSSNGGALVFDGTDDHVTIPDSTDWDFTTAFSIDLWVYVNSYDVGGVVFIHQQSGASAGGFEFWVDTNNLVRLNKNGAVSVLISGNSFTLNTWHNVVCTHNGTAANIFMNATNIASSQSAALPDNVSGILRIGGYTTNNYDLNGRISTVKLYNRALTAAEVQQNYNATKSRFGL